MSNLSKTVSIVVICITTVFLAKIIGFTGIVFGTFGIAAVTYSKRDC
jgi:hypothetical protein